MISNYHEYTLNGIEVTLILNTKNHVWKIWVGSKWRSNDKIHYREPDLEFTKAKGACVVQFLEKLKEIETNDACRA